LEEVKDIADDVIVLDSGSADKTEEIAKQYGAKFSYRAFDGFGQQKRAGEDLCAYDWVLNLDADEFLTEELAVKLRHSYPQMIKPAAITARAFTQPPFSRIMQNHAFLPIITTIFAFIVSHNYAFPITQPMTR